MNVTPTEIKSPVLLVEHFMKTNFEIKVAQRQTKQRFNMDTKDHPRRKPCQVWLAPLGFLLALLKLDSKSITGTCSFQYSRIGTHRRLFSLEQPNRFDVV